jgi:hypothetical protein
MDEQRISFNDPVEINFGTGALVLPAFMVWQIAINLQKTFLEKYEPAEGIATAEEPKPVPYFRLKVVKNG